MVNILNPENILRYNVTNTLNKRYSTKTTLMLFVLSVNANSSYLCKIKALFTFSRMWITVSWLRFLPVSRTVTTPTLASRNFRISEEIIRTDVTAFTSIAGVTVADRLAGTFLQVTAFSVGVLCCLYIRTRTGTTRNLVFSQYWISKISDLTSLTKTEIKGVEMCLYLIELSDVL